METSRLSGRAANRFHFTKAALLSLNEPGYYYDAEIKGLAVRLNKNRTFTFMVYRRFLDSSSKRTRPERIVITKVHDFEIKLEPIRRQAAEILASHARDENPMEPLRAAKQAATLEELFQFYLDHHAIGRRKSWQEMDKLFRRSFADWLALTAEAITRSDVLKKHKQLKEERGSYAANRALQLLRAVYNRGIRESMLTTNPAALITLWPELPRNRVLQRNEIARLQQVLDDLPDQQFADFIRLLLSTGQRKANVLAMRWQDIDLQAATWGIPGEVSKNGQAHTVALTSYEIAILHRRRNQNDSPFVFPGPGRTGHYIEPKRAWTSLRKTAGLANVRLHDLRRTNATTMVSVGANIAVVKAALNHRDIKTTLTVYALADREDARVARERTIDKLFPAHGQFE